MTRTHLLSIFTAMALAGCASKATVIYNSNPLGAAVYEQGTGNYLGNTPLIVEYPWSKAYMKDKCLMVNGVAATWASGAKTVLPSQSKLCLGKVQYQIDIPYQGNADQLALDAPVGAQQTVTARQSDDAAIYILGAAMISSAVNLAEASNNHYYTRPPQTRLIPSAPGDRRVSSLPGCYSDIDCGAGLSCVKPPLSSAGTCMQRVNEFGTPLPTLNNPSSILPNTSLGHCTLNSECPIGFRCDLTLKACVK